MRPCQAVDVCFVFTGKFWTLRPKYIYKLSGEKNKKQSNQFSGLAGFHIEHVCQISGFISKKRRGHWMLNKFGAEGLNQLYGHGEG